MGKNSMRIHRKRFKETSSLRWLVLPLLLTCAYSASSQTPAGWTPIGPPGGTVFSLARDPFNSNVLFAGTYFGGLYRSDNGGAMWSHVAAPFSERPVFAIAFDRANTGTAYVGTFEGGIYKTTDGGQNWEKITADIEVRATCYGDLEIDPTNSQTLFFTDDDWAASMVQPIQAPL